MPPIQNNMQGLPQIVVSPVQSKIFSNFLKKIYWKSSQFIIFLLICRFVFISWKFLIYRHKNSISQYATKDYENWEEFCEIGVAKFILAICRFPYSWNIPSYLLFLKMIFILFQIWIDDLLPNSNMYLQTQINWVNQILLVLDCKYNLRIVRSVY